MYDVGIFKRGCRPGVVDIIPLVAAHLAGIYIILKFTE